MQRISYKDMQSVSKFKQTKSEREQWREREKNCWLYNVQCIVHSTYRRSVGDIDVDVKGKRHTYVCTYKVQDMFIHEDKQKTIASKQKQQPDQQHTEKIVYTNKNNKQNNNNTKE